MRILIPEKMDEEAVAILREQLETIYDPTLVDQPEKLANLVKTADALIVRKGTLVNAALVQAAPRLRVVARLGVGLDNIDLAVCRARNITVIPALDANKQSVAEYVIAVAMVLLRPVLLETVDTARGLWPRMKHFSDRELHGKVLGLIGFGSIGQHTARVAKSMGMGVIAHDPMLPRTAPSWRELNLGRRSLDELLGEADIVSIHVPLLDATRNLVGRKEISRMKPGAILINTARGGIVDEHAVVEALKSGHLGGAGLDVFEREPLPPGSIFEGVPNLLLTPHMAGNTAEAEKRIGRLIAGKVLEILKLPAHPAAHNPVGALSSRVKQP